MEQQVVILNEDGTQSVESVACVVESGVDDAGNAVKIVSLESPVVQPD